MSIKAIRRTMISCYAQIINDYVLGYKIPELVKHEKIKARNWYISLITCQLWDSNVYRTLLFCERLLRYIDSAKIDHIAVACGVQGFYRLFRTASSSAIDINDCIPVHCKSGYVVRHAIVGNENGAVKMLFAVFLLRTHV